MLEYTVETHHFFSCSCTIWTFNDASPGKSDRADRAQAVRHPETDPERPERQSCGWKKSSGRLVLKETVPLSAAAGRTRVQQLKPDVTPRDPAQILLLKRNCVFCPCGYIYIRFNGFPQEQKKDSEHFAPTWLQIKTAAGPACGHKPSHFPSIPCIYFYESPKMQHTSHQSDAPGSDACAS